MGYWAAISQAHVCDHGSRYRTPYGSARIRHTEVRADGTAGRMEVCTDGLSNANHGRIGRPVAVVARPNGSLLISDGYTGAL